MKVTYISQSNNLPEETGPKRNYLKLLKMVEWKRISLIAIDTVLLSLIFHSLLLKN